MMRRTTLPYALAALLALAAHASLLAVTWEAPPRAKIQARGAPGVEIRLAAAPTEAGLAPQPAPEPERESTPEPPAPQPMPASVATPATPARVQSAAPAERRSNGRPAAPSQAAAAATAPEPLGTMENKSPRYPELARRRGQSGEVTLRATVSAEGLPLEVIVTSGSGHSLLDKAALEAVRQWRFRPARLNGREVSGEVLLSVEFRLE